jgi:cobalamin 5'-phosphate synthase/cobalamin synthase
MRALLVATAFLTRVPVRVHGDERDVGHAARWFPLVGTAIGGLGALLARGFAEVPNLTVPLQALVLVGLGAWITGAIHLDGLADTADAFGGGRDRDDVLRIMRDPRVGSFGALALVLIVGIKVAAIAALLDRRAATRALIAASTLSRWTIVALGAWLPYARPEGGLGRAVAGTHGADDRGRLLWATAGTAAVVAIAAGWNALVFGAVTAAITVAVGRTARRRIGGVTGDVFGAAVELTETAVLIGAVLMTGRP